MGGSACPTTAAELVLQLLSALEHLRDNEAARDQIASALYVPHPSLPRVLSAVRKLWNKKRRTEVEAKQLGRHMERLASLAFRGLRGWDVLKSYRSPTAQYDLLVNGSDEYWRAVCSTLRLASRRRGMLVEVKGTVGEIDNSQFLRLCGTLHIQFPRTIAIGIFFTLSGATGFPTLEARQQHKIGQARLQQVLFYARHKTPVVVLTWHDLLKLTAPGSLVRILSAKIRDIEELGNPKLGTRTLEEVELPEHMR